MPDSTIGSDGIEEVSVNAKATPVPSTLQYLRKCQIVLADAGGSGLDFSALKVTFQVRRGDSQTPNACDLRIYNLSDSTANQIQNEFTQISLSAGYEGNMGLIFTGSIKQARRGRIDGKDSYVDVTAADGDEAYNFAPMSLSLRAGATPTDAAQQFLAHMGSYGITKGYQPTFSSNGLTRGRVFYGLASDELRDFAESNDVTWSIQDGALTFIPLNSFIPSGAVPIISQSTGMIGVPEQTQNGISVTTLLNPQLKIGQRVKLQGTVNLYRYGLDLSSGATNMMLSQTATKTNADGMYYVMRAEHVGDTRGEDWYTQLTCLAVDALVPESEVSQSLIAPAAAAIVPR
jgi:hypothetical protein